MADPLSIIGAVGAVANIIDLVTKTINGVREIRGRWQEADLALLSLASQLTALRAALTKIQNWASDKLTRDPGYQVLMVLDSSISCCSLLIEKFDSFLSDINGSNDGPLNFSKKIKLVVGVKDLESVQKMLEAQVSALNLLLTAFNCKSISEQKALLQRPKSRRIIGRVETDSASLIVHRDSSSFMSNWTDNLSKFSICFDFDRELFVTRVYEKVFRISIKNALTSRMVSQQHHDQASTRGATPKDLPNGVDDIRRSRIIDRELRKDRWIFRREVKILVLGDRRSGKEQILNHMKFINHGGYTTDENVALGSAVHETVLECVLLLLDAIGETELFLESDATKYQYESLVDYISNRKPNEPLENIVGNAIHALWNDHRIRNMLDQYKDYHSFRSVEYFFSHIHRITAPGYTPSNTDLLHTRFTNDGVYTTRFAVESLTYHFSAVDLQKGANAKWLHQFEGVISLLFIVDLSCYDEELIETRGKNQMKENMLLFSHVVNMRWFNRTPIIILFNQVSTFERKVAVSPLEKHFPEFTGGNNPEEAKAFIYQGFRQLIHSTNRDIYRHFKDPDDASTLQSVNASTLDIIVHKCCRAAGI